MHSILVQRAELPALQVEMMARSTLKSPVEIQVGGRSVVNEDIAQFIEIRQPEDRFMRLLELLGEWQEQGKILVFVNSQEQCDKLFRDLLQVRHASAVLPFKVHFPDRSGPTKMVLVGCIFGVVASISDWTADPAGGQLWSLAEARCPTSLHGHLVTCSASPDRLWAKSAPTLCRSAMPASPFTAAKIKWTGRAPSMTSRRTCATCSLQPQWLPVDWTSRTS